MSNILTAKVDTKGFVEAYIKLWNGGLQLTPKEVAVMSEIVLSYMVFNKDGVNEPYLTDLVFATKNVNRIKSVLDLSKQNWGNYKIKLKEKRVLIENGERIELNRLFLPKKEITFRFELIDDE